jgi:DNA-binding MarR family transcriptional regulator
MVDMPAVPTPGFLVWRLSMKWRTAVDRAVAPFGLTHAKYSVLASLYGMHHEGRRPSQRELADRTGLEVVFISKLAQSLERDGLITRTRDPGDSRAVEIAITIAGLDTAGRAIAVVHALMDELTAPLGGTGSDRTARFMHDLQLLINAS